MIISDNNVALIREKHLSESIVITSGTFDLFHIGHLNYLNAVKQYGEILVVLMSGDLRVHARKGDNRPIIPENERARILDALRVVDYVLVDNTNMLDAESNEYYRQIVSSLQPAYYVTDGPDPRFKELIDSKQFIILERVDGGKYGSTTNIVSHIASL